LIEYLVARLEMTVIRSSTGGGHSSHEWRRGIGAGRAFIILEMVLVVSTGVLFFMGLRHEYKWILVSLMMLTSILGILFAFFTKFLDLEGRNEDTSMDAERGFIRNMISPFPLALGVVTISLILLLNPDTGIMTYFLGISGGALVLIISSLFLEESGSSEA